MSRARTTTPRARKQPRVYLLPQPPPQSERPSVWIDRTKGNEITYGVRISARSLDKAADVAMATFEALELFAFQMETAIDERRKAALVASVEALKERTG